MLEYLFNKVAGLKAYNFIKKRLQRKCFPVNIAKFLPGFSIEHLQSLLLASGKIKRISSLTKHGQ